MDHRLLEILACPLCKGKLVFDQKKQELLCKSDALAYPIHTGIPVLLECKARNIIIDEHTI